MRQFRKNKPKASSIFQSIKLTKDAAKNLKKKLSPFRVIKDKKEPIKIISSRTTINRFKDKKKNLEDIKKKIIQIISVILYLMLKKIKN